eukprot:2344633-Pleurochrysis_carterae.AAC.2
MIAYVGDTLIDDCFGFVKVMGHYENSSLLIRKNSGQGEEQPRTEGHVKCSFSKQLVADRKQYFKEDEELQDNSDEEGVEEGEAAQTADGCLGADGGAAGMSDGIGEDEHGADDEANGGSIAEGDQPQSVQLRHVGLSRHLLAVHQNVVQALQIDNNGTINADGAGGGVTDNACPDGAACAQRAKDGKNMEDGAPIENLPLLLAQQIEGELLEYGIAPHTAKLGFYKESVRTDAYELQ